MPDNEDRFRQHDVSVILLSILVLHLSIPLVHNFCLRFSKRYASLSERYLQLLVVKNAVLCLASSVMIIYLLIVSGILVNRRSDFIRQYLFTTRAVLAAFLTIAFALTQKLGLSSEQLLLFSLESVMLLWALDWESDRNIEPGIFIILLNAPCIRSVAGITIFEIMYQDSLSHSLNPKDSRLGQNKKWAKVWTRTLFFGVLTRLVSGLLLISYMIRSRNYISLLWQLALPMFFAAHFCFAFPSYLALWNKSRDPGANHEEDEAADRELAKSRVALWLYDPRGDRYAHQRPTQHLDGIGS